MCVCGFLCVCGCKITAQISEILKIRNEINPKKSFIVCVRLCVFVYFVFVLAFLCSFMFLCVFVCVCVCVCVSFCFILYHRMACVGQEFKIFRETHVKFTSKYFHFVSRIILKESKRHCNSPLPHTVHTACHLTVI